MHIRSITVAFAAFALITTACSDSITPTPLTAREQGTDSTSAGEIAITPAVDTVEVGRTIRFSAAVTSATGDSLKDARIFWGVDDTTAATIDSSGALTARKPGSVRVVAVSRSPWLHAFADVVIRPGKAGSAEGTGSLFSGYSAQSPHWPHIRTFMTDFYHAWTPEERAWAGAHYDYAMAGNADAWRAANGTVGHLTYTLLWTVFVPGQERGSLASGYYADMKKWYRAHPQYTLEKAFLHEAGARRDSVHRVVVSIWASDRWVLNVGDPGLRAYQLDRYRRITADGSGVFIDESSSGDILPRIKSAEYPDDGSWYERAYTSLLASLRQALGAQKPVMINIAEYSRAFDRANAVAAGAVHLEKVNNPLSSSMAARWDWVESLLGAGVLVDFAVAYSSADYARMASRIPEGNSTSTVERLTMWELASYYMVVPERPDRLTAHLETGWSEPYSSRWLKAVEANIGHPTGERHVLKRGKDPLGQGYLIFARDFDRALVLVRTQQGWDEQTHGDKTGVEVTLPAGEEWLPLAGDGTLGAPVTSVTLRAAEAVILIKKSTI